MPITKHKSVLASLAALLVAFISVSCSGGGGGSNGGEDEASGTLPPPIPSEHASGRARPGSFIAIENAKAGTFDWKLANPAVAGEIEGYASLTSVNKGAPIDLYVNTSAPSYNIDVYRMGYYGGKGARLMRSFSNIAGQAQPMPCINPSGVIECNWAISRSFTIPDRETDPASENYWASGVYLAKLTTNTVPKKDSYIIFVVRDDARQATYVSLLPVTTYQAYNYWGGKSLYTGCAVPSSGWHCADSAPPVPVVSFNRPYGPSSRQAAAYGVGAGEFLSNVQMQPINSGAWDYNMVRWMEKQGYDVKYITNVDLHEDSAILNQAKAFIAMGHDEYYSKPMWDRLIAARGAGINLAFFTGNNIYWQMRFNDGVYGSKMNRIMITYRGGGDPVADNNLTTDQFRYLGRPEASLVGNQYVTNPIMDDITITNAAHWLFTGSGAVDGTVLKGLLGYEINAFVPGISPSNTKILAHSISNGFPSDVTFYVAPSSAQVFATGTIQWSWGLDDFILNGERSNYASPIAQAITANVFAAIAEKNISTITSVRSGLDLSTPLGYLDPAQVLQNTKPENNSKTNQWRLLPTNDENYYQIVSRATGLCLAANGTTKGEKAEVDDCSGLDQQKWRLDDLANGAVSIIEKRSGRCLEAPGGANSAGVGLMIATCNGGVNQQWKKTAFS